MSDEVIYKYPLKLIPVQTISAPISRILTIQAQNGNPCLWAVVNRNKSNATFEICLSGTGTQDGYSFEELTYISTMQISHLVLHWFYKEVRPNEDKTD